MGILSRMTARSVSNLLAMAWLIASFPAQALETDQFYAWGHPIQDSSEYLNAWLQFQIQTVLDTKAAEPVLDCEAAVHLVQKRLQHSIYQPMEMWITTTTLVDRFPRGLQESRHYRDHYLLANTFSIDFARWLQPSPTIQINEIRLGSDKLAHFFSEGWWFYKWWKKHRDEYAPDKLQREMLRYGLKVEWWVQGKLVTGVVSPADMEANYQGFLFYHQMCHGDAPFLRRQGGRWYFSEGFDIRNYVSPEWDESWNANIYSKLRWSRIRLAMTAYCPMLNSPWVEQQRARYRELDRQTPTEELIAERVAAGKMPDPRSFDITSVCDG